MRYLKLTIAYDGANYVGWQVQLNGNSVQQVLEEAWHEVTRETVRITASGRTDSGVHALAQVCSLPTGSTLSPNRMTMALNANLPDDVRVLKVEEAPSGFHAIRDSIEKTYRYQIQNDRILDVMQRKYRWQLVHELDQGLMQDAADLLVGTHDFSSFEAKGAPRNDSIRTVSRLQVDRYCQNEFTYLDIEITANGFLYNMVRNIVGSLVKVGNGRKSVNWMQEVLDARNRMVAADTAPAHALFLVSVVYETFPESDAGPESEQGQ